METNNTSTKENPVGRFMVAGGAVIELGNTGKILIIKRAEDLDWQPGNWEIVYGRLDQFEDLETGLRREVKEEVGISNLEICKVLTAWHIFRGKEKSANNELIGITFHCKTDFDGIKLSAEHSDYKFASPRDALNEIKADGIRRDVLAFNELLKLRDKS